MSSSASSTLTPLFARMSAGEWRLARFLRDHIVLVEGLIGSGKSTLTTRLTRYVRERLCLHAVHGQHYAGLVVAGDQRAVSIVPHRSHVGLHGGKRARPGGARTAPLERA